MNRLDKVKDDAENFLKYRLVMVRRLSELNPDEAKEFNSWYITHPTYQVIPNMLQSIKEERRKQ
jgi:hypothetical protein